VSQSEYKKSIYWSSKANVFYNEKEYFDCLEAIGKSLDQLTPKVGQVPSITIKQLDRKVYD
jgi:hypothetical protein